MSTTERCWKCNGPLVGNDNPAVAAQCPKCYPADGSPRLRQIQCGDVVKRADGTRMTVDRVQAKRAYCIFFRVSNAGEKLMRAWYPLAGLTFVERMLK